jgi:hypothetical protein
MGDAGIAVAQRRYGKIIAVTYRKPPIKGKTQQSDDGFVVGPLLVANRYSSVPDTQNQRIDIQLTAEIKLPELALTLVVEGQGDAFVCRLGVDSRRQIKPHPSMGAELKRKFADLIFKKRGIGLCEMVTGHAQPYMFIVVKQPETVVQKTVPGVIAEVFTART